jgi:hypothetical protein
VLGAGAVLAGAVGLRQRQPAVTWLVAGALACTVAYVLTPYTALGFDRAPVGAGSNTRYLLPAALLAAPAVAWVVSRLRRGRLLAELVLLAGIADGLRRGVDLTAGDLAVALALVAAAGFAALAWRRWRQGGRPTPRRALVAGALVAGLALAFIGHIGQQRFFEGRYRGGGPALDRALALAAPGSRIGVAGAWKVGSLSPIYPLFGPRLENEVSTVGGFADGAFRAPRTSTEFAALLSRRRFELLLIGRERLPFTAPTDDIAWATAADYIPIAEDSRFVLLAPAGRDIDGP